MFKIDNLLFAQPSDPITPTSVISSEFPTLDVASGLYYIGDENGAPLKYSPFEQVAVTTDEEVTAKPDVRLHVSTDTTLTAENNNTYYLVDTSSGEVTVTLPKASTVEDGFRFGVNRDGANNCTIVPATGDSIEVFTSDFVVLNGYMYEFMKSPIADRWDIVMKEVKPEVGKQSHLVGFWMLDGRLKLDVLATSELINIDLTKYNMKWKDGSPSWRFLDSSVEIQQLLDSKEIVLHD